MLGTLSTASLDAVLMVITYHEISDYEAMLKHVTDSLKPGGRFLMVEMAPAFSSLRGAAYHSLGKLP